MPNYPLPRLLTKRLERTIKSFPVVVVTGARQTGKSTLVRAIPEARGRPYFTLDTRDVLSEAATDPDGFVRRTPVVTLDEVQRAPELLLSIKQVVDEQRNPGQFLLTGSANLLLMHRVAESLAGRAIYHALWPLTFGEQLGRASAGMWETFFREPTREWYDAVRSRGMDIPSSVRRNSDEGIPDWRALAMIGGYPTPSLTLPDAADRQEWFREYTQTYLERDLQDLAAIDNLTDFQRLMRAVTLRLGTLENQAELGRDIGMSRPTVRRYLGLMETSYQLVRVEPYSVNRTKRLIKAPKLYWSDTGLALHLAGSPEPGGAHFENMILHDLLAWRDSDPERPAVLYWRTANDEEVDFVIERQGRVLPIEVKATDNPGRNAARHLRTFLTEYPDLAVGALLLHSGRETYWLADNVLAAPWWAVL